MAYITEANLLSVTRKIDKQKLSELADDIYERKINFVFSQLEKKELSLYRQLFREPASFVESYFEKYKKVDTMTYVDEGRSPAYHQFYDCSRLLSAFEGIKIPPQIMERGEDEAKKYRNWFKQNSHLLERPGDLFFVKLAADFNISIQEIEVVHYENSGVTDFNNLEVSNVNENIDALLASLADWLKDEEHYEIIVRHNFGVKSFLYNRKIESIPSDLTEEQIKRVLKEFIDKFKKPLHDLLVLSYRIEYNRDLSFDETILEQLGFKPCGECKLGIPF